MEIPKEAKSEMRKIEKKCRDREEELIRERMDEQSWADRTPYLMNPELYEETQRKVGAELDRREKERKEGKGKAGFDVVKSYKKSRAKMKKIKAQMKPYMDIGQRERKLVWKKYEHRRIELLGRVLIDLEVVAMKHNLPGSKREIVIYTNPERLHLKKGGDNYQHFFWTFNASPKFIDWVDKIWFAVQGKVVGYFSVSRVSGSQIHWHPDFWEDAEENIEVKAFRGFRYRWW